MKELKYKQSMAYASSFVSFVLPKINVEEIILFGSIARKEAGEKSDIDLFFNIVKKTEENRTKKTIDKELNRFYKSKINEIWRLKGIKNHIKFEVGDLNRWKLKRSIISDGIVLYGKYKNAPEKTKGYVHFNLKPIKDITKRNRILRKIFGRKEKSCLTQGIINEIGGKKLSPTSFIIPINKTQEILRILNSEKLDFNFFEFWSDNI